MNFNDIMGIYLESELEAFIEDNRLLTKLKECCRKVMENRRKAEELQLMMPMQIDRIAKELKETENNLAKEIESLWSLN